MIVWQPTDHNGTTLDVGDIDEFISMMKDIGFTLPCTLDDSDLPVMRAAAALYIRVNPTTRNVDTSNPFKEIVELILANNSIDLLTI